MFALNAVHTHIIIIIISIVNSIPIPGGTQNLQQATPFWNENGNICVAINEWTSKGKIIILNKMQETAKNVPF